MIRYIISFIILLVFVFSFISCQSESGDVPKILTKEDAVRESSLQINKNNAEKAADDLLKEIEKDKE